MRKRTRPFSGFVAAVVLLVAAPDFLRAQQQSTQDRQVQEQKANVEVNRVPVLAGKKIEIQGIILKRDSDSLLVMDNRGAEYRATLSAATEIKEKKSNPFRGAKSYTQQQLLEGMEVHITGRGDQSGNIAATRIRATNAEVRVAEAIEKRVTPVEQNLGAATTRLGQAEQNALRLSGQVDEVSSVANAARGGAKGAQEAADRANELAGRANDSADRANAGVDAANTRITSIDDFQVKNTAMVNFKVGSSLLSKEAQAELDRLAQAASSERAFVIEVSGYASSEGPASLNRRLSQNRADEVIRYLAENYDIPLRRFITPIGLGTSHPLGDNGTRSGRQQNRRVEVKVLVSKGLTQSATTASGGQIITKQ